MSVAEERSALLDSITPGWWASVESASAGVSPISVLFSGGLDSSLVAFSLRDRAEVELVTVGVTGSPDLAAAGEGAQILELPWTSRIIDRSDVKRVLREDGKMLQGASTVSRAVLVSTALGLDAAGSKHILCGQGADELFLGYAHFERLSPLETAARREADLDRLLGQDWPRATQLAARRNKRLSSPYIDPTFLALARVLSVPQLRMGDERKPVLRSFAERLGLPLKLVHRPKKAFQYGSGVDALLRSLGEQG